MAVKTLPELKVSDLLREYKSSFVDSWEGLDKTAKDFKSSSLKQRWKRSGPRYCFADPTSGLTRELLPKWLLDPISPPQGWPP